MKFMEYVEISDEMISRAITESKRREEAVTKTGKKAFKHHFSPGGEDVTLFNNVLGFLGQFAFCEYVGLDWRESIRKDYSTIEPAKIEYKGNRVSVKTERIAPEYLQKVLDKSISEKEKYSTCLYPLGQINLLKKYNIVFYGAFSLNPKDHTIGNLRRWYPLGWIEAEKIMECPISPKAPSGANLPYPAFHISVKCLKHISELNEIKNNKLMYRERVFDVKGFVVIDSTDIENKKKDPVMDFEIYFNNQLAKELERRCNLALQNGTGVNLALDEPTYTVKSDNNRLVFTCISNKWENILPWDERKAYTGRFLQVQFWLPERKDYFGNLKKVVEDVKSIGADKPLKRMVVYIRKPLLPVLLAKCAEVCKHGRGLTINAKVYFRVEETNSWRGIEHKFEIYSGELGNALGLKLSEENDDPNEVIRIRFSIKRNACCDSFENK
ncbi:MAG: hypothetical protein QXD95_09260 [Nitrososphaeria archaeon]